MKKIYSSSAVHKLIMFFIIFVVLMVFLVILIRSSYIKENTITPTNYRVLVINPKTSDTLMDKSVNSLNPMTLDSLTLYLNTRKK